MNMLWGFLSVDILLHLCDLYVQLYEASFCFIYGFSSYALRVHTSNNFATLLIFLHLSLHMILFKDNSAYLQVIPSQYCVHAYHVIHMHTTKYQLKEKITTHLCVFVYMYNS